MRFNLRFVSLVSFIIFFAVALAGTLLWANLNFVHAVPGGADFLLIWKGGQDFMLHGDLPYGDFTAQLRDLVYGRAAQSGPALQRLGLPFYLLPIFFPFAMIPDPALARAAWMVFLEIVSFGLVFLMTQVAHWKPGNLYIVLLMLFSVFWAPASAALLSGSPIIFQALLVFAAIRAIETGLDEPAGAMLALAWFNLEAAGLVILLVLFWAATSNRLRIWAGFWIITIVLVALSAVFNINWLFPFLGALVSNWGSNPNPSTFSLFIGWFPAVGLRFGQGLALIVALVLIAEWRAVRGKDIRWLLWTAALTIAAAPLLGLPFAPGWLALSFPALLVALSIMEQRWGPFGRWSALALFTVIFLGLWAALWGKLEAVFVLFFPIMLISLLYWVRWWAVRPPRLWADLVSEVGK